MKLTPAGAESWGTFLGGPEYERAYAIEVDDQGYIYLAGRAGAGKQPRPERWQRFFLS